MLTVHHLRQSQSERIVWLCEELGIEYELKLWDRDPQTQAAPPEYKAMHPIQTAPIITDGDVSLGESGAIVEYICGKHAGWRLCPQADDANFAQHLFWLHFANGTFMTNAMMQMAVMIATGEDNSAIASHRSDIAWAMIEEQLGKTAYFGGEELTSADVMMGFGLTTMRAMIKRPLDDLPNIRAYLKRIGERPAYRKAMERAEPGVEPRLS